jgi:hypothetical protein
MRENAQNMIRTSSSWSLEHFNFETPTPAPAAETNSACSSVAGGALRFAPPEQLQDAIALKRVVFLLCAFFFFAASGCMYLNTENGQEPGGVRESVLSRFESGSCYGLEASIKLDRASAEWSNIVLSAIYTVPVGVEGGNRAKFALFFPNGGKIGQCERVLEDTECSSLSFPGAETLVRSAFAALDGLAQRRYGTDKGTFIFEENASGYSLYSFKPAHGKMNLSVSIISYLTKL